MEKNSLYQVLRKVYTKTIVKIQGFIDFQKFIKYITVVSF